MNTHVWGNKPRAKIVLLLLLKAQGPGCLASPLLVSLRWGRSGEKHSIHFWPCGFWHCMSQIWLGHWWKGWAQLQEGLALGRGHSRDRRPPNSIHQAPVSFGMGLPNWLYSDSLPARESMYPISDPPESFFVRSCPFFRNLCSLPRHEQITYTNVKATRHPREQTLCLGEAP